VRDETRAASRSRSRPEVCSTARRAVQRANPLRSSATSGVRWVFAVRHVNPRGFVEGVEHVQAQVDKIWTAWFIPGVTPFTVPAKDQAILKIDTKPKPLHEGAKPA
jgi:hypothetical protein